MLVKQKLLQIMTTECYLNTALHGSHAAVCSDLEWFGPSLPHKSILAVLEFLGMPKDWLRFYNAFLSMPVRFPGDPQPRVRRRGTPIGYSLSALGGECICFIMDFAVNQRANGLYLYRMHDDLWLWDSDVTKVALGWAEMQRYASIVGLNFNAKKTGSAYIGPQKAASAALPTGEIRWGFLKFDPEQNRFLLDQGEVDQHIVEMRRQLESTKSVFGWVNVYNKYMAFFFRNFGGTPAKCFGREHVNELVDTLARIQRELFPPLSENRTGGPVGYLRRILEQRFGVTNLPEGYFYFPIGSGGLELRHIMLELLALEQWGRPFTMSDDSKGVSTVHGRYHPASEYYMLKNTFINEVDSDESVPATPTALDLQSFQEDRFIADQKFVKRVEYDTKAYSQVKGKWEHSKGKRTNAKNQDFMTFEEYTSLRETWLRDWGRSYNDMLAAPRFVEVTQLPKLTATTGSGGKHWGTMDWYEKWVMSMYGAGVIKKYGGVKAVDPALIPMGMVELFRTSRIKLDQ